jgi:hypothetical protein
LGKILENEQAALYRQWIKNVASFYTLRELAKASDTLPGISGVAEVFRSRLEDEYIAGLWKKDLINGLVWFNINDLWDRSCSTEYHAPSWSWASVGYPARYGFTTEVASCVVIEEVCYKLAGKELMGAVADGWLTMSGRLARAWIMLPPKGLSPRSHSHYPLFTGDTYLDFFVGLHADCLLAVGSSQTDQGVTEETAVRSHEQPSKLPVWDWGSV